jgi:hypothetical protein
LICWGLNDAAAKFLLSTRCNLVCFSYQNFQMWVLFHWFFERMCQEQTLFMVLEVEVPTCCKRLGITFVNFKNLQPGHFFWWFILESYVKYLANKRYLHSFEIEGLKLLYPPWSSNFTWRSQKTRDLQRCLYQNSSIWSLFWMISSRNLCKITSRTNVIHGYESKSHKLLQFKFTWKSQKTRDLQRFLYQNFSTWSLFWMISSRKLCEITPRTNVIHGFESKAHKLLLTHWSSNFTWKSQKNKGPSKVFISKLFNLVTFLDDFFAKVM